jgi:hypothetical protein
LLLLSAILLLLLLLGVIVTLLLLLLLLLRVFSLKCSAVGLVRELGVIITPGLVRELALCEHLSLLGSTCGNSLTHYPILLYSLLLTKSCLVITGFMHHMGAAFSLFLIECKSGAR